MLDETIALWTGPWLALRDDLVDLLPRLLSALLLLLLGIAVALAARRLAEALLQKGGADQALPDFFVFRVWSRNHPGQTPSQGLALAAAYAVFLAFALASAHVLGGAFGQELLHGLLRAAPRLLTVLLMLLMAVLLASGAGLLAQIVLSGSGSRHTAFWGKVSSWATFVACALFALEPLGLAGQVLGHAVLILLAGLSLGVGLAFGLGCKDLAREMILEMLKPDPTQD